MTMGPRRARISALAKINLDLKVLGKRPDGFHELRTVYQTISLADTIEVEFVPSPRTAIRLEAAVEIPDNLVLRAARMVMDATGAAGRLSFRLTKRIPAGAGLGGGSSDAAAVLLALPVLVGKRIRPDTLIRLAAEIGSDVPFFLLGGTAVGVGRGSELYPLPDVFSARGLVVVPSVRVSTAEAYGALGRQLTTEVPANIIDSFQSRAWLTGLVSGENDFERAVFGRYPRLKSLKKKLLKLGADPAMMTGSGSALFGIFRNPEGLEKALSSFHEEKVFRIATVSRARYRSLWWRRLGVHIDARIWPPQSRYEP